jgi:hypothetical protein
VDVFQVTKIKVGLEDNPMADAIFGTTKAFTPAEVRLLSICVHFEQRGTNVAGTGIYSNFSRVAAWLSPLQFAEIDTTNVAKNFASFSPYTLKIGAKKTYNLRIGTEFDAGRFGTGNTAPLSLVIATEGYLGTVRITHRVRSMGHPYSQIQLVGEDDLINQLENLVV